jgi:predicted transcriptional regulator
LLVPRIKDAWLGFKEKSIEDKIKELQKQQEIVSAQRGAVGENIKNIEEDATNDIEQIDKKLEETTEDLRKTTKMEELLGTLSSRLSEAVEAKEQKYPKKDANIEGDQE